MLPALFQDIAASIADFAGITQFIPAEAVGIRFKILDEIRSPGLGLSPYEHPKDLVAGLGVCRKINFDSGFYPADASCLDEDIGEIKFKVSTIRPGCKF